MTTIEHEAMSGVFTKIHVRDAPSHFILHEFHASDEGDAHDHPFDIDVTILKGGYIERRYDPKTGESQAIARHVGDSFTIPANAVHRITSLFEDRCMTLATYGPRQQQPGFWRFDNGPERRQWDSTEWVTM